MTVFVLCWQYGDKSSHGIVGWSSTQKEAEHMAELLREHSDSTRQFYVVATTPLVHSPLGKL